MTPQTAQPSLGLVSHPPLQFNLCWDGHTLAAAEPKAREQGWAEGKDFPNKQHSPELLLPQGNTAQQKPPQLWAQERSCP